MAKFPLFGAKSILDLSDDEIDHLPHHVLISRALFKFAENIRAMTDDYFFIDVIIAPDYLFYEIWLHVLDPYLVPDNVAPIYHRLVSQYLDDFNELTDGKLRNIRMCMIKMDNDVTDEALNKKRGNVRPYFGAITTIQ